MTLKKTIKYTIFTFLIMLLFIPNVNASTKYLLCEYGKSRVRIIFQNGSYAIGGGKDGDNWSVSDFSVKNNYRLSEKGKLLKDATGLSSCPSNLYINNTSDSIKLSSSKTYTINDRVCWYDGLDYQNDLHILSIPSLFHGSNKTLIDMKYRNNVNSEWYDGQYKLDSYLPLLTDSRADTWKNISKSWYYIKYVDETGCPASVHTSDSGSAYFTNVEGLTASDLPAKVKLYGQSVGNLVCNQDWLTAVIGTGNKGTLSYLNEQAKNRIKAYESYDYDAWNNLYKTCKKEKNCLCKTSKTLEDYALCRINSLSDTETKKISEEQETTKKEAIKNGCLSEYQEQSDKLINAGIEERNKVIEDLIDKIPETVMSEKAKEEAKKHNTENMKKAKQWIDDLFKEDHSALDELTENTERNCEDIFGKPCDKDNLSVLCLIQRIFDILKFLIPGLLIVLGSIDFSKVVLSNDKEAMSKAVSTFIKRVIMAIAIFFLPTLVSLLINIFNSSYTTEEKIDCVIDALKGD